MPMDRVTPSCLMVIVLYTKLDAQCELLHHWVGGIKHEQLLNYTHKQQSSFKWQKPTLIEKAIYKAGIIDK